MKRCCKLFTIILLLALFVISAVCLSADALEDIDRAVSELGDFLLQKIPDSSGQNLTILSSCCCIAFLAVFIEWMR